MATPLIMPHPFLFLIMMVYHLLQNSFWKVVKIKFWKFWKSPKRLKWKKIVALKLKDLRYLVIHIILNGVCQNDPECWLLALLKCKLSDTATERWASKPICFNGSAIISFWSLGCRSSTGKFFSKAKTYSMLRNAQHLHNFGGKFKTTGRCEIEILKVYDFLPIIW